MLRGYVDRFRNKPLEPSEPSEPPEPPGWEFKGEEERYSQLLQMCATEMQHILGERKDVTIGIAGSEHSVGFLRKHEYHNKYITVCITGQAIPSLRIFPYTGTVIEMTSSTNIYSHTKHTGDAAREKLDEYGLGDFVDSPFFSDEVTASAFYKDFEVSS